jgi:hypothetical protein
MDHLHALSTIFFLHDPKKGALRQEIEDPPPPHPFVRCGWSLPLPTPCIDL